MTSAGPGGGVLLMDGLAAKHMDLERLRLDLGWHKVEAALDCRRRILEPRWGAFPPAGVILQT